MPLDPLQRQGVRSGRLDVGRLFVDTKQVYLDARANAAEFDAPKLRVDAMFTIVELLGRFIDEITRLRASITEGEQGLKGFDADLAGLRARYRNLYRRFFDDVVPIDQWTADQWTSFEEDLEGPILLWDLKTCQERWGIAFVSPPCEGPDLQMALSLLHQTGVALEHQEQLVASLYGVADLTMQDVVDTYGDLARSAGRGIAEAFGAIGQGIKDYVIPPKVAKRVAWGFGVAAAVGIGGYLWINNNDSKKRR